MLCSESLPNGFSIPWPRGSLEHLLVLIGLDCVFCSFCQLLCESWALTIVGASFLLYIHQVSFNRVPTVSGIVQILTDNLLNVCMFSCSNQTLRSQSTCGRVRLAFTHWSRLMAGGSQPESVIPLGASGNMGNSFGYCVIKDAKCPVTCKTISCPSLHDNGDSSRNSKRPSVKNCFSLTIFVFFPGFKVL